MCWRPRLAPRPLVSTVTLWRLSYWQHTAQRHDAGASAANITLLIIAVAGGAASLYILHNYSRSQSSIHENHPQRHPQKYDGQTGLSASLYTDDLVPSHRHSSTGAAGDQRCRPAGSAGSAGDLLPCGQSNSARIMHTWVTPVAAHRGATGSIPFLHASCILHRGRPKSDTNWGRTCK